MIDAPVGNSKWTQGLLFVCLFSRAYGVEKKKWWGEVGSGEVDERVMGLDLIKINYIRIQNSQKKIEDRLTRRRRLTENRNLLSSINEKRE